MITTKSKTKKNRKLCQEQGTAQLGTSLNVEYVQGDKILEEGEGINKSPKESRSYQRIKRSCHKSTEINLKSATGQIWDNLTAID